MLSSKEEGEQGGGGGEEQAGARRSKEEQGGGARRKEEEEEEGGGRRPPLLPACFRHAILLGPSHFSKSQDLQLGALPRCGAARALPESKVPRRVQKIRGAACGIRGCGGDTGYVPELGVRTRR